MIDINVLLSMQSAIGTYLYRVGYNACNICAVQNAWWRFCSYTVLKKPLGHGEGIKAPSKCRRLMVFGILKVHSSNFISLRRTQCSNDEAIFLHVSENEFAALYWPTRKWSRHAYSIICLLRQCFIYSQACFFSLICLTTPNSRTHLNKVRAVVYDLAVIWHSEKPFESITILAFCFK